MIRVNQWGYDWGYPAAYIELMCMDTTILHYPTKDKNGKRKITKEEADATVQQWRERQQATQNKQSKEVKISLKD